MTKLYVPPPPYIDDPHLNQWALDVYAILNAFDVVIPESTGSDESSGESTFIAENKSGTRISRGQVVTSHASGIGVVLADASDTSLPGIGIMTGVCEPGAEKPVLTENIFVMTDWSAVVGTISLQAKARYYLAATPGRLTVTPPSLTGQGSQFFGVALSATALDLRVEEIIKL